MIYLSTLLYVPWYTWALTLRSLVRPINRSRSFQSGDVALTARLPRLLLSPVIQFVMLLSDIRRLFPCHVCVAWMDYTSFVVRSVRIDPTTDDVVSNSTCVFDLPGFFSSRSNPYICTLKLISRLEYWQGLEPDHSQITPTYTHLDTPFLTGFLPQRLTQSVVSLGFLVFPLFLS